jgi:hypothetical protein
MSLIIYGQGACRHKKAQKFGKKRAKNQALENSLINQHTALS